MTFSEWLATRRPGKNKRGDLIRAFRERGVVSEEDWRSTLPDKDAWKQFSNKERQEQRAILSAGHGLFRSYYDWCFKNRVEFSQPKERSLVLVSVLLVRADRPELDAWDLNGLPERTGVPYTRFHRTLFYYGDPRTLYALQIDLVEECPDRFRLMKFRHVVTEESRICIATNEAAHRLGAG